MSMFVLDRNLTGQAVTGGSFPLGDVAFLGRQDRRRHLSGFSTRHWAQVPPPPQAEGTKSFCSASVCSSFPPAGTEIVFSPLIVMSDIAAGYETDFDRAAMMIVTKPSTISGETAELQVRMSPCQAPLRVSRR